MCGDRGNSICDGVQFDETGPYMTGPTAPYQRKMTAFPVAAGYGEHHFSILPPEFDGGIRPFAMNVTPALQSPGYTYVTAQHAGVADGRARLLARRPAATRRHRGLLPRRRLLLGPPAGPEGHRGRQGPLPLPQHHGPRAAIRACC